MEPLQKMLECQCKVGRDFSFSALFSEHRQWLAYSRWTFLEWMKSELFKEDIEDKILGSATSSLIAYFSFYKLLLIPL